MKKNKLLEFFIFLIAMNFLIDIILTKSNQIDQEIKNRDYNYKDSFRNRKLQNNSTSTDSTDVYKDICISKNYSYELMDYIDPFSKTLTEVLNFTFIKNTDSSVIYFKLQFVEINYQLFLFILPYSYQDFVHFYLI